MTIFDILPELWLMLLGWIVLAFLWLNERLARIPVGQGWRGFYRYRQGLTFVFKSRLFHISRGLPDREIIRVAIGWKPEDFGHGAFFRLGIYSKDFHSIGWKVRHYRRVASHIHMKYVTLSWVCRSSY